MAEQMAVSQAEQLKGEFKVKREEGVVTVSSPHIELESAKSPLRFAVTLEKVPTAIEDGTEIEGMTVDRESLKLQEMLRQAQELRNIPEGERPRRLLELLRSNVHFAYDDMVEELGKTNPSLAEWVARNTGIRSSSTVPLTLSEVVDSGYGVCRHLSVAMLALAKEAGMEGAFLTNGPSFTDRGPIKNVVRKDNGEPLFKMSKIGDPVGGHAWIELKTAEGEWIPVDPSAQLVGDTPEGLETFRDANYRASVGSTLELQGLPSHVGHNGLRDLEFLPGEAVHTGTLEINSQPEQKPLVISFDATEDIDDNESWPKPTNYQGSLTLKAYSVPSTSGANASVINIESL
jgi:hypothetical protein